MTNCMKILKLLLFCILINSSVTSQNYIDTVYTIATVTNIQYGSATNFAGEVIPLHLDISYPTNAPSLDCGKPLTLIIHGGAFAAGSKEDATIIRLRQDFAKRGYVAASINYRLGYFQSDIAKNCNIPNWNCLNLADSAEWIRAWYRGVQDAKGALRYLVNNQNIYDIDPANIFVIGESAGAFIALGVGYLDDENEKPSACFALPNVNAPHSSYYTPCIQNASYSIPIANMNLSRPDLGSVQGNLNPTANPYQIKGVGSFYGALFVDLFSINQTVNTPALYMFHQPNDLIVPIGYDPVFKGFNTCAINTGCVSIQDRPFVYGSQGINQLVSNLSIPANYKPFIQLEVTNNTSDCLGQVLNPATGGHQYDNFWLRTQNLATFFSSKIGANDCESLSINGIKMNPIFVYPNPTNGTTTILLTELASVNCIKIVNAIGQIIETIQVQEGASTIEIDLSKYENGIYLLNFDTKNGAYVNKLIKQ